MNVSRYLRGHWRPRHAADDDEQLLSGTDPCLVELKNLLAFIARSMSHSPSATRWTPVSFVADHLGTQDYDQRPWFARRMPTTRLW